MSGRPNFEIDLHPLSERWLWAYLFGLVGVSGLGIELGRRFGSVVQLSATAVFIVGWLVLVRRYG